MTQIAVTDSHALVWYATGHSRRLGRNARRLFGRVDAGRASVYVPTLVLVEVLEAAHRGHLRFPEGAAAWVEALAGSGSFLPVDLTPPIVLRGHELYAVPERADRLIAATASYLEVPLITRDPAIAEAAGVELVW